jgi:3-hydroxyacyl-CoA dehydrogenase/3a,7a,12a-trihydroxy-5b-cholest-24-enoyl-CoA hydratase
MAGKYGRIINIGSGAGLYGNFGQANYSSAKMGILGLTNTLSLEGAKNNININCIVPVAGSRMTEGLLPPNILEILDPRHVASIVAFLCHESSLETGQCFEVGGGWYSKVRIQRSGGIKLGDKDVFASAEDIATHLKDISNFDNSTYPKNPADIIKDIIATPVHNSSNNSKSTSSTVKEQESVTAAAAPSLPLGASHKDLKYKSDVVFSKLSNITEKDPAKSTELTNSIRAFIQFEIADKTTGTTKFWLLDAKTAGKPSVQCVLSREAIPATFKPYTVIQISDEHFVSLIDGKLSPEFAYLRGTLKIQGSMGVALRIKQLISLAKD